MFYRYLSEKFRNLMRTHSLSDDELRQAAGELKAKQKKTFIGYIILAPLFSVLLIGAAIWETGNGTNNPSSLWTGVVLAIILAFAGGYFLLMGLLKFQFNRELKKDYPHLYDECKL
ncbi:MAG: hypothetical protein J5657_05115 [Clostridiales bacterium]|nr:hypothetical protein [Clostridiales bacterium]